MIRWWMVLMGVLALAAGPWTVVVRGDERDAALEARLNWARAERNASREHAKIERRILRSFDYLGAVNQTVRARADIEAMRRPVLETLVVSTVWQEQLVARTALERKLAALHESGADYDQIVHVARELSQVRQTMTQLRRQALEQVEGLDEARERLVSANDRVRELRASVREAIIASDQWQSARADANAARETWVTAAGAAERAAAARWAAEQSRLVAMFWP